MEQQLRDRIPVMERLLKITGQPGVSVGVIHENEIVLRHHIGMRDVETGQKPDDDTLYCIASLAEAFMVAVIEQLEFRHQYVESIIYRDDPLMMPDEKSLVDVTLLDIFSHRTDLLSLDEITRGSDGYSLVSKKDVVRFCQSLPLRYNPEGRFLHNNALYALLAHIIEIVSGSATLDDCLRDRLFEPLGMTRTTAKRDVLQTDTNIAVPYVILGNGKPSRIVPTEASADSMDRASGGVMSSLNDMLKWCVDNLTSLSSLMSNSPMFKRTAIVNPESAEDGDYCAGWCYHRTPAKLGLLSPNRLLESPMVGLKSPPMVVYSQQGDMPGYTCNLYIVPESHSAIVVLSNGTGLSDATDWIAQDLLQTMHHLKPAIDFIEIARTASEAYLCHYTDELMTPAFECRQADEDPLLEEFISSYTAEDLDGVHFQVVPDPDDCRRLLMIINGHRDQAWEMWYYQLDTFCYLPQSRKKYLSRGYKKDRRSWNRFLIVFQRDDANLVTGFSMDLEYCILNFHRKTEH